ncbi:MAG TPA: hypothetical protein VF886_04635, partial [Roseiarcus sp.]
MYARAALVRIALFSTVLGALTGCDTVGGAVGSVGSSVGDFFSHQDPNAAALNAGANPRPVAGKPATNPSDKPKVLPVASQDINCPEVQIASGGAALRVGGPDNASVRYQFNIGDTARQCDPAGPSQAALKVGVKGAVVIGPAGSAGTFSAPLKISVTRESDKTDVFSQTYQVEATTDGVAAGAFRVVTDPIMLPMSTLQLADVYSITVGFEGGTNKPSPTPTRH